MITLDALREACNEACTCGGGGPGQPGTCPACEVWHALKGAEAPIRWASVYGGHTMCADGEPHRPSLSQSGGIVRCARCGNPLGQVP